MPVSLFTKIIVQWFFSFPSIALQWNSPVLDDALKLMAINPGVEALTCTLTMKWIVLSGRDGFGL